MKVQSSYKIFIRALIVVLFFSALILPGTNADAAFATSNGQVATSGGTFTTSPGLQSTNSNPYGLNTSNIAAVIPSVIGCTGIVNTYHNLVNNIVNGGINSAFSYDTNPSDSSPTTNPFSEIITGQDGVGETIGPSGVSADGSIVDTRIAASQPSQEDLGLDSSGKMSSLPIGTGLSTTIGTPLGSDDFIGIGQPGQTLPDITPITGGSIIGNLPGSAVPTTNQPMQDLLKQIQSVLGVTKANTTKTYNDDQEAKFREECLNGVAVALAKSELAAMTQKTVNWVNQGYNGNPLFVRDQQTFFQNIANQQLQTFIGPYSNPANATIYPFGRQFATSTLQNQQSNFYTTSQSTLQNSLVPGATTSSFGNDFSQGGWAGWFSFTQNPQNNPLGFNMLATQQLANQTAAAQTAQQNELNQNNGFLSQKQCVQYSTTNTHGALNPADCLQWQTVTPGSVIEAQLNNSLDSATRQLELADNINKSLDAVFANLINQLTSQGLSTLSSTVNTDNSNVSTDNSLGGAGDNSSLGVAYDANGNQITVNQGAGWANSDGSTFDITKDLADTYQYETTKDPTKITFKATPPPACSADGQAVDTTYPGCHTDGNAENAASYDPNSNSKVGSAPFKASAKPQCSDGIDNDGDGLIDAADPGCHTDGDVTNTASYDPFSNTETDSIANVFPSCMSGNLNTDINSPGCYTDGKVYQVINSSNGNTTQEYNALAFDPYHNATDLSSTKGFTSTTNVGNWYKNTKVFPSGFSACSSTSVNGSANKNMAVAACHTDQNASNASSYNEYINSTAPRTFSFTRTAVPLCSADGQAIDTTYPWCHTDGDAGNTASYDPYHNPALTTCSIKYFHPSSQTIAQGASSKLTFETTGSCASTALSGDSTIYNTDTPYTVTVTPSATTTYALTTTNSSGYSASNSVTILVGATSECNIDYFYATPATINAGTSSDLKWSVSGTNCPANSVKLSGTTASYANSGNQPITPLTTTTYTLKATDASNNSVSIGSTTVTTVPQESKGIFAKNPPPQCSDGIDNDGDGLIDTADPACHTDGDVTNTASYDPFSNTEAKGNTQGYVRTQEGAISIQGDYVAAVKNSLTVLPKILPALGELDYCIPGPNPDWANVTADEINATSAYLESMQYTPTVPPNGITLPASVSSYVQQISTGPRAQADFAKALPAVVSEVEQQMAVQVNVDRIAYGNRYQSCAQAPNQDGTCTGGTNPAKITDVYSSGFNNYFYGGLNTFLESIPVLGGAVQWFESLFVSNYNPSTAATVQQEYQLEQTQFQAIVQAEIEQMNTNYTTYKTQIDALYGPGSPMQTPGSQWYLPVAAAGLEATKDIRTYETNIADATTQYNQLIAQTNENIDKLTAMEKTVKGIVQTAENRLCAAMNKAPTGTYCEATPASLGFLCGVSGDNNVAYNPNDPNNGEAHTATANGNTGGSTTIQTPCTINAFNSNQNTISYGSPAMLTWATTGCSQVIVTGTNASRSDVNESNGVSITPKGTNTYTLYATASTDSNFLSNYGSYVLKDLSVAVTPPAYACSIDSFTSSPSLVSLDKNGNASTTLSWQTSTIPGEKATCSKITLSILNGLNKTPVSGTFTANAKNSTKVSLKANTTYLLTASDSASIATAKQLTVSVASNTSSGAGSSSALTGSGGSITSASCSIDSFTASPSSIAAGNSTTLTWATSNCASVSLSGNTSAQKLSDSVGITVKPTTTTKYEITATDASGSPIIQDITVTVTPACIIKSFANSAGATSITVTKGSSTTLTWSTTGCSNTTLNYYYTDGSGGGQISYTTPGTATVTPAKTAVYTLAAVNSNSTSNPTSNVTVTVK